MVRRPSRRVHHQPPSGSSVVYLLVGAVIVLALVLYVKCRTGNLAQKLPAPTPPAAPSTPPP